MKSEETIMLGFVILIVVAVPFVWWMIRADEKRQEMEEKREWQERNRKK